MQDFFYPQYVPPGFFFFFFGWLLLGWVETFTNCFRSHRNLLSTQRWCEVFWYQTVVVVAVVVVLVLGVYSMIYIYIYIYMYDEYQHAFKTKNTVLIVLIWWNGIMWFEHGYIYIYILLYIHILVHIVGLLTPPMRSWNDWEYDSWGWNDWGNSKPKSKKGKGHLA